MEIEECRGGWFSLVGPGTRAEGTVESEGGVFRARILSSTGGWGEEYEAWGASEKEALESLISLLPSEPTPPYTECRPCVLCGAEVRYSPFSGRNKIAMPPTGGLPEMYAVCDSCGSTDTDVLQQRILAVPMWQRLESEVH